MRIDLKNNKGMFTVEAVIVVSTILFILSALIFSFMLMYQKALLTKSASLASQQGAEIWTDSRKVIEQPKPILSNKEKEKEDPIYWRTDNTYDYDKNFSSSIDISSDSLRAQYKSADQIDKRHIEEKKFAQIKKAIYAELYKGILKPKQTTVDINYNSGFLKREIKVTLTQEVKIPFGKIKALFDGKDTMTLSATGTALVTEPAEYIRNVDFAIDMAKMAGQSFNFREVFSKK